MKLYRILKWELTKYKDEENFEIGCQGNQNLGLNVNFENAKEIFEKLIKNETKILSSWGKIFVLNQTDTEYQLKMIEENCKEHMLILKIVEVEINL